MPGPCTLIVNPLSGGYSRQKVSNAVSTLQSFGFAPLLHEVTTPNDATQVARRVCERETDPLIIVGAGDGTINSVVNTLLPGSATLAILPMGTSNVLSRELGIESTRHALEKIAAGITRPASVGLIEKDGSKRYFILMAGIGCDGSVVRGVRTPEKRLLRNGAYVLSALRLLFAWETGRLQVTAGPITTDCHSVIVCNASKYAGDRRLAPGASLFEPEFQVVCMQDQTRRGYLKVAWALLSGKESCHPGIRYFPARDLEVRGTKPLQADGDYYFQSPVTIRSVPDFVRLIV
jgi:diacylglycerol kinase (ATP)